MGQGYRGVRCSISRRAVHGSHAALENLCVEHADSFNDTIAGMWHDPSWNIYLLVVSSIYDIPVDDYGLYRVPDVHCHIASLIVMPLGAGSFRGDGEERPTMFNGTPWVYSEWLTTDGVVPVIGQMLTTTSVLHPVPLSSRHILDPEFYDVRSEEIRNLKPRTNYRFEHKFDHVCITGAFNPNINKVKYHQLIARFVEGISYCTTDMSCASGL